MRFLRATSGYLAPGRQRLVHRSPPSRSRGGAPRGCAAECCACAIRGGSAARGGGATTSFADDFGIVLNVGDDNYDAHKKPHALIRAVTDLTLENLIAQLAAEVAGEVWPGEKGLVEIIIVIFVRGSVWG